jgi:drug/metabolite transporter (DMT)-like permease
LLEHCGPTAVSTVACFFPVVGMILGFIFLEETFSSINLAASMIIFLGMLFVNEVISLPVLKKKEETALDRAL